ncbi:hypothetical protein BASA81_007282 [Batrachochytrium salamandrivorans]|nr:hypothetical protein BASA81_007282 [Batrachochytrium salamandrivorans]
MYFWVGNLGCIILGGTGCGLAALAFASQAIVAPLGGLTIVWNLVLSGGGNRTQMMASLITLLGMSLVVWFGPGEGLSKPAVGTGPFVIFTLPRFQVLGVLYCGVSLGLESAKINMGLNKSTRRVAASAVGGVVGGLSNVFAKSAVEFYSSKRTRETVGGEQDYVSFCLVAAIALLLAGTQIALFNQALASFPVAHVVPVYMTSLMLSSTLSGGVAFDEFRDFSLARCLGFTCAMLVCVMGVAFLSFSSSSSLSPSSLSPGDEESKD